MTPARIAILVSAVCLTFATPTYAQNSGQDGVKVGEMSIFRKLGGGLESKAAMQYSQTMQQAQQQNALAPDSNPQLIRLRAIAKALIPLALRWNERAPQWKWEVNLIGSKQINAYCMPGGKIAFYTGILDTLKLTDDEVAIVMGHEIAHALREHGAERAGKAAAANFGIKLAEIVAGAKGYDPNVAGSVAGGLANVGMLKFSRDDETEADVVGLDIAARAGYDPRAGIALWKKWQWSIKVRHHNGYPPILLVKIELLKFNVICQKCYLCLPRNKAFSSLICRLTERISKLSPLLIETTACLSGLSSCSCASHICGANLTQKSKKSHL